MEIKYLSLATTLQDDAIRIFWKDHKGFVSNTGESVWRDNQEFNDNVTPSAVSTSLLNLLWLSELTLRADYSEKLVQVISEIPKGVLQYPLIYPRLIEFYEQHKQGLESVALVTTNSEKYLRKYTPYEPNRFIVIGSSEEHPVLKGKKNVFPEATYYICKNKTCSAPREKLMED
jgi:uncharacterized protein YyaL (SSP411 family)